MAAEYPGRLLGSRFKRVAFDEPPITELVRLPNHEAVRILVDNAELSEKVRAIKRRPVEFFRVDIGEGVELDGWCMKPHDFNSGKRYPLMIMSITRTSRHS